jgi:hypothetical protein
MARIRDPSDRLRLVLGNGRQDVNRQSVCLREVDGMKLDAAVHQVRDERHVAGEAVELGDDQGRIVKPAEL